MQKVGLWQINEGQPHKIHESGVDLEQQLEAWIEADPSLLQAGLSIVGRQVEVEGGRLDLLALDLQGRWVIIEIKRGVLRRETIAQALDYASCIDRMPADELQRKIEAYLSPRGRSLQSLLAERDAQDIVGQSRELVLVVVGTGKAPGLDRMVDFLLERYGMPISLVSFDVFELADGQRILARELTEPETDPTTRPAPEAHPNSVAQVCSLADEAGIGQVFRAILASAQDHGLHPRPFKTSIMYAPPSRRTRMLFTVWAKPTPRGVKTYISPEAFAEFYPITEEEAQEILGEGGWREFAESEIGNLTASLRTLFQKIESLTEDS
jgi:Holliday junction resolvase-like predicted endonuclease